MLLNSFINYCQSTNHINVPTGLQDSVLISINDIRIVNEKLIERKYYIKINKEQEEIIKLNNDYINEQHKIIDDLQDRIVATQDINNKLQKEYEKEKKNKKIAIGCASGFGLALAGVIVGLVLKK